MHDGTGQILLDMYLDSSVLSPITGYGGTAGLSAGHEYNAKTNFGCIIRALVEYKLDP